jgi:hypothetical protein
LAENVWTTLGENPWTSLGENSWPILGENTWTIIVRKMTQLWYESATVVQILPHDVHRVHEYNQQQEEVIALKDDTRQGIFQ